MDDKLVENFLQKSKEREERIEKDRIKKQKEQKRRLHLVFLYSQLLK